MRDRRRYISNRRHHAVPMLCEEAGVQYVYVHSKEQLGAARMTKRPTSVMLVLPKAVKGSVKMGKDDEKEFEEMYKSVHSKWKECTRKWQNRVLCARTRPRRP